MKKLAGLVIILAVLVLGGYYGMGYLTEHTISKNIDVINQTNGLTASIDKYQRGLFSSTAEIKWSIHVPERVVQDDKGNAQALPAQDYQMDMPLKIYHGPIMFVHSKPRFGIGFAETTLRLPSQFDEQFNTQFTEGSTKPSIDLSIFLNYLLNSNVKMALPQFKLVAKEGVMEFDWLGMESYVSMSSNKEKIDGNFDVNGFKFSKDDVKGAMGKIDSEYRLHETSSGLYLGDASFSMPSFELFDKEQSVFSVQELSMNSNSEIEQALFSTHFNMSLKAIHANKQVYGPGVIEITVRNLDADILAKINQQSKAMKNGSEAERQQAMLELLPQVPKLLSKGAEIEISKLNFKIPEGDIDGNLLVSLPREESANPFELVQKVQGHAKVKVPAALVKVLIQQAVASQIAKQPELEQELTKQLQANSADNNTAPQPQASQEQLVLAQTDKQIATMQQNGLLVQSGTDFVVEMSLEQGKFSINGKPFDSSMLKF